MDRQKSKPELGSETALLNFLVFSEEGQPKYQITVIVKLKTNIIPTWVFIYLKIGKSEEHLIT